MSSFPSKQLLTFDMPEPKKLEGKFEYSYFTIDELLDENATYAFITQDTLNRFGVPRKVVLNFDPAENLAFHNPIGKGILENSSNRNHLFGTPAAPSPELQKLTSEILLQSNGYVKVTSDIHDIQTYVADETGGSRIDTVDAFFAMSSDSSENAYIKELSSKLSLPEPTYINPSTGQPTIRGIDSSPDAALQTMVAADFVFDIMEASAMDPFSPFSQDQSKSLKEFKRIQTLNRQLNNPSEVNFDEYFSYIDEVHDYSSGNTRGLGILGYIVFKYEISSAGEKIPKAPILVANLESGTLEDAQVKYGSTYEYNLYPLCYIRMVEDTGVEGEIGEPTCVLAIGSSYRQIKIKCIEKIPPPCVNSIQFDYDGTNLILKWSMPVQINSRGGPVGDIKGYQIFTRNNINESFKLYNYIDFNDSIQKYVIPEHIPEKYVRYSTHPVTEQRMFIEKDKEYIITMCTIDAHGNSSNYSAQYRVSLDSRTNRLIIKFGSYPGAPKQYPNFMFLTNMFKDSMTVSGAKKVTVFYKPTATDLKLDNASESKLKVATVSNEDADGETTPVYRFQMIDLNTQEDKIFDIHVLEEDLFDVNL